MSSSHSPGHETVLVALPADLATLAAHIAEDEAAIFGRLPDRDLVAAFADGVISLLFPDGRDAPRTPAGIHAELEARCRALVPVLAPAEGQAPAPRRTSSPTPSTWQLPVDPRAADPGRRGHRGRRPGRPRHGRGRPRLPGFQALAFYRIAHALHEQGIPLVPRMISEIAHGRTGADIHPAARIGRSCCIDHGTGLVVGETADHRRRRQALPGRHPRRAVGRQGRHPDETPPDHRGPASSSTRTRRSWAATPSSARDSVIGGNVWLTDSRPAQLPRLPPEPGPRADRGRGRRSHRLRDLRGSVHL